VIDIRTLPNVDVPGPEFDQSVNDLSLVFDGLADQIEMDRVLRGLRFRDADEDQAEASAIDWQYAVLGVRFVGDFPTQRARPELRKRSGIVCVIAKVSEPRRYLNSVSRHRDTSVRIFKCKAQLRSLKTLVAGR
jgi:hypothetical protein